MPLKERPPTLYGVYEPERRQRHLRPIPLWIVVVILATGVPLLGLAIHEWFVLVQWLGQHL